MGGYRMTLGEQIEELSASLNDLNSSTSVEEGFFEHGDVVRGSLAGWSVAFTADTAHCSATRILVGRNGAFLEVTVSLFESGEQSLATRMVDNIPGAAASAPEAVGVLDAVAELSAALREDPTFLERGRRASRRMQARRYLASVLESLRRDIAIVRRDLRRD